MPEPERDRPPSPASGTVTGSDSAAGPDDAQTRTAAPGAMLPATNSPRESVLAWFVFGFFPYSAEVHDHRTVTPRAGLARLVEHPAPNLRRLVEPRAG